MNTPDERIAVPGQRAAVAPVGGAPPPGAPSESPAGMAGTVRWVMTGNAESIFAPRYRSLSVGMIVLVALFVFETLGVATAMPAVAKALDGLPLYGLAFAGAMAASVIGMTMAGGMADAHGPRASLRLGVAWFAIGLLMAGLAPAMWVLLLGRIVQGFGGGLMSVALHVVVGRVYPPAMHARIFTAFATAYALPAVVGPVVSGLLVEHAGWRWVFLAVPPVAVAAMRLMMPALRDVGAPLPGEPPGEGGRRRAAWAIGAAGSVLLLHDFGDRSGALRLLLPIAAVLAMAICARHLLPAGTLRASRGLPSVVALRSIASAAFFGTEVFLPLLLSRERGLSPVLAGVVLTLGALGWSGGSWYRGRMANPMPARVLRTGLGLVVAGVLAVASAALPATPVAMSMAGWMVAGVGMGLALPSLSVLALELSPPGQQGASASALQLGGSLCTAAVLALSGLLFGLLLDLSPALAYLAGFALTAALAMLGALLTGRVGISAD